jgi:hypothetical protein
MLGLVPAFIPYCVVILPAVPQTVRFPVLAWKAICITAGGGRDP